MVNRILAGILSLIIPGLGQFMQGEGQKGIVMIIIAIIIWIIAAYTISWPKTIFTIISIIYPLYAAYNAYMMREPF
ncbi:MAG: hypothetical protein K1X33_07515 [Methanobacteriaceae archaeon]|nr:hypothetical protein [Methanobacteriaceae archaeon]